MAKAVTIRRKVRQSYILSPLIFNLYSEEILREALVNTYIGILLNGERINNTLNADVTVIFTDNMKNL